MNRLLLPMVLVVLSAGAANAQIVNGDFEQGAVAWTCDVQPAWACSVGAAGGNVPTLPKCGLIMSPSGNSGGMGCLRQGFSCGQVSTDEGCLIQLDYTLGPIDADPLAGRVVVFVDGVAEYTSAWGGAAWTTISFAVICGTHEIALCLEVQTGNNLWLAKFDNVSAEAGCTTEVAPRSWGSLKSLYR